LPSWIGSASSWRSPRKLGAAQAVTDASALDGARLEVAVNATGVPEAIETASGCSARAGRWWSSVCRQPRAAISVSPSRVYNDKSLSPGRWLSCPAWVRPDGGYSTAAASPACWPRSGTSRSDQHFITCSSHFPGHQLRSVTDLGIPPATEAISMPDRSPGIQPRSVLIAPEPGGGLGRGPGCDVVAFGERPDRLDTRAGGRWPGRLRAHDRPAAPCNT
jgi:hypothetical protein